MDELPPWHVQQNEEIVREFWQFEARHADCEARYYAACKRRHHDDDDDDDDNDDQHEKSCVAKRLSVRQSRSAARHVHQPATDTAIAPHARFQFRDLLTRLELEARQLRAAGTRNITENTRLLCDVQNTIKDVINTVQR